MQSVPLGSEWWRRTEAPQAVTGNAPPIGDPTEGRWAARALVAFTVMLVLAPQQYLPILGQLRVALLVAVAAIAARVFGKSTARPLPVPVELKIVIALVAWATLTVPFAIWPGGAFATLADRFAKSVAVFWLLGCVINSVGRLRALAWTLALTGVPLAVTGVMNYRSGAFELGRVVTYGGGLASNANDVAITLNLFIPLTVTLALTAQTRFLQIVGWVVAAIAAAGVVVTFSRQGFLALAIEAGLLILFLMRRRLVMGIAVLAVSAIAAVAVVPSEYRDRMSNIFDVEADATGSSQARVDDNRVALEFVASHPLVGAGVGGDVLALNQARVNWTRIHNTYLSYSVDLGLPGLGLFVALLVTSLRSVRRVERAAAQGLSPQFATLAAGIRIGLIGFIVTAFFAPVPYHFYLYYIAGLSVALKTIAARQFGIVV